MKTFLFSMILTFGMSVIALANPDEKSLPEMTRVESHNEKIRITLKEPLGKVFISIFDEKGKLVARNKFISKEPLIIPYDMSRLPVGNYRVKIATMNESTTYEVKNEGKKVEIRRRLMAYGKVVDNNTINLLVVGVEQPGIHVKIYDNASNKLIYKEDIMEPNGFSKNYKLAYFEPKDVYFYVEDTQGRSRVISFE